MVSKPAGADAKADDACFPFWTSLLLLWLDLLHKNVMLLILEAYARREWIQCDGGGVAWA